MTILKGTPSQRLLVDRIDYYTTPYRGGYHLGHAAFGQRCGVIARIAPSRHCHSPHVILSGERHLLESVIHNESHEQGRASLDRQASRMSDCRLLCGLLQLLLLEADV